MLVSGSIQKRQIIVTSRFQYALSTERYMIGNQDRNLARVPLFPLCSLIISSLNIVSQAFFDKFTQRNEVRNFYHIFAKNFGTLFLVFYHISLWNMIPGIVDGSCSWPSTYNSCTLRRSMDVCGLTWIQAYYALALVNKQPPFDFEHLWMLKFRFL